MFVKVLDISSDTFYFKGAERYYREVSVLAGHVDITAYVESNMEVKCGNWLEVGQCSVTNKYYDFKVAALVLDECRIVAEEHVTKEDDVLVQMRGMLIKPAHGARVICRGGRGRLFYSCAVRSGNGRGKQFSILLVGFNKRADDLQRLPDKSSITVLGHLNKTKGDRGGYEINVIKVGQEV